MSDITPETVVAATPPTPENVARMLTEADNDLHDGNNWKLGLSSAGNVVSIRITPYSEPDEDDLDDEAVELDDEHFWAVVGKGEQPSIVVASPEFLAAARALYRWHVAASTLASDQFAALVYEVDDALAALTPERVAVLAGDDVKSAQEQKGGQS